MTSRLVPVPDDSSAPYWAACANHVLALPRCSHCQSFSFPPDISCPHCHSLDPAFTYEPVKGAGKLRSWTIIRQSFLAGFDTPFVLADVELDGLPHIRMIGRLLDGPEVVLTIGEPVSVVFEDIAPGIAIPAFAKQGRP